jgi:UDP-N-acetylglucosamine acyltransferase
VSTRVHPGAFVDPAARLGMDVVVGPGAVVGPDVTLGDRVRVDSHALVTGWTKVGADTHVHHGAVLGTAPQDLKYEGKESYLEVGEHTELREYVTANLATDPGATTHIGSHCLLMAYAHVAHNCRIGDHVIIANAVQPAGYVTIEDWAIVGGGTLVHQFTRIGRHAMVGGGARVTQDIAPFIKVGGSPLRMAGLNRIGLERRGFAAAVCDALEGAYRVLFRKGLTVTRAVEELRRQWPGVAEVEYLARFAETSARGLAR